MFSRSQLLNDLTGPHSLNPFALAISIPGAILFSIVAALEFYPEVDIPALLIANIAGFGLCSLFYLLLDKTLYRNRETEKVKLWFLPIAALGFGCTKGIVTGTVYWWFRPDLLDFPDDVISRMIQATSIAGFTLPLAAVLTSALFRFREERESLILEQVKAELTSDKSLISLAGKAEMKKLRSALLPILEGLRIAVRSGDSHSRSQLSKQLRENIERVLRPVSQRIWFADVGNIREFNTPQLGRLALQRQALNPIFVPGLFIALFLPSRIYLLGLETALALAALVWLVSAAIFWLALKIPLKSLPAMALRLIAAIGLASLLVDYLGTLLISPALQLISDARVVTGSLLMLQSAVVVGVIGAALETRSDVIRSFAKITDSDPNDVKIALGRRMLANRNLAQFLHGQVQNKMLSIALRLDSNQESSETPLELQIEELEQMLLGVEQPRELAANQSLEQVLSMAEKSWQGFLDLDIRSPAGLGKKLPQKSIEAIAQVLDEAIGNAWRHGNATELKVVLSMSGRNLTFTAKDNGIGPTGGNRGLGSVLFDSVAGSNWRLEKRVGSGTTLTVSMPVSTQYAAS